MTGLPVLRGLDDETSAFPQAAEGLLSIINPKWQLQKQLIQNSANPEALQALANMEAKNPGITQQIFGGGRGTNAVTGVSPDVATQAQIGAAPAIKADLANPDTQEHVAANLLHIPGQDERTITSNEAKASQYTPVIAQYKAAAAQFEPAIAQAQLSGDQTRLQMLQQQQGQIQHGLSFLSTYKGELTPEAIERGDIKPEDLNALMSLPIGQHLVQTEMQRYYVTQMQIAAREQMSATTQAQRQEAAARSADLKEKNAVLPIMLKNNLFSKGFSVEDAQNFMFHGGSKLIAQSISGSEDPVDVISKSPELKNYVRLGVALGDNFTQGLVTKMQPQVNAGVQKLTGQLNQATMNAQNKKGPKKANVNQFHSEVEQIINRVNTMNDLTGQPKVKGIVNYDAASKSYKFNMVPVEDKSTTPTTASSPSGPTEIPANLKTPENAAKYTQLINSGKSPQEAVQAIINGQ